MEKKSSKCPLTSLLRVSCELLIAPLVFAMIKPNLTGQLVHYDHFTGNTYRKGMFISLFINCPGSYLGTIQGNLVPPSHFTATLPTSGSHRPPGSSPPMSWFNPGPTSAGDPLPANAWLAISQARQEILELKKENQRIMMLQGNISRGETSVDHLSDHKMRYFH